MRKVTHVLALAALGLAPIAMPAMAQESAATDSVVTDPTATLKNADAPAHEKMEACRLLGLEGTPDAVPVLAGLLNDPQLAHPARYALEPMPFPEAGAALRDALGTTDGALKAGVISSLGVRKDEDAVPALGELLGSDDTLVAQAAARALGQIGNDAATNLLTGALGTTQDPAVLGRVCDALIAIAESQSGDRATTIYETLRGAKNLPGTIRAAATQGAIVSGGGEQSLVLLLEALGSEDEAMFSAALRAIRTLGENDGVTRAVSEQLANLPAERRVRAIEALGERSDLAAGDALLAQTEADDEAVRIAAIRTIARIGFAPALPRLQELALADEGAVTQAARDAISYFPGEQGDALVRDLLVSSDAATRSTALELVSKGALPDAVGLLMTAAQQDSDQGVRLGALKALRVRASFEQVPALLALVLEAQSADERDAAESALKTVFARNDRGEVPAPLVQSLQAALNENEGETQLAVLRVLGATGSSAALETVRSYAANQSGALQKAAQRALIDWPTEEALPDLFQMAGQSDDGGLHTDAVRGAVRLLRKSSAPAKDVLAQYQHLFEIGGETEKKVVLSGVGAMSHPAAFDFALQQWPNEALRAEAVQAAANVAGRLGGMALEEKGLFNGADLSDWQGAEPHWRVEDGLIVGGSDKPIPKTTYLWAPVEVGDFYLRFSVQLEPNTGNSGMQFRTSRNDAGEAFGLQADIGQDVWARIYDQGGRGKFDWNPRGEEAIKPGDWNQYEILVVGPAVWFAINGKPGVAALDLSDAPRRGMLAMQLHQGAPMTVRYQLQSLVHNPKVELAGMNAKQLVEMLAVPSGE